MATRSAKATLPSPDAKRVSHEALREDGDALRTLLNAPTEARLLIDTEGRIVGLNERACERLSELAGRRLGRTPEHLLGTCVYDLFPADLAVERQARNAEVLRSGEIARFEDEREGRWMDNTICPVLDRQGAISGLVILSRDITELKAAQEALAIHAKRLESVNQYLVAALEKLAKSEQALERALAAERERARRDTLTGVLNHGAIIDQVRRLVIACGAQSTFTVAMIDVDGMKETNDAYGHQVGDEVLVNVARALSRGGAIVGRYGGDEFLAVLPRGDREAAERYCRDVQQTVASARVTDPDTHERVPVVISVGLATYPQDGDIAAVLIKLADGAMYAGRGVARARVRRPSRAAA